MEMTMKAEGTGRVGKLAHPTAVPLFIGQDTPARVFRARAVEWADRPALRHKRRGLWQSYSWTDYYANACAVGLALSDLGLSQGDTVSVLAENRPEWLFVDMGAQAMGMVGNGVYPTSSPDQLRHILTDSRTRLLVVENQEQLDKALTIRDACPDLTRIVVIDPEGLRGFSDPAVTFFADLLAQGHQLAETHAAAFEAAIDAGQPGDLAFLVYTSGTTGAPKGAMIQNSNVVFQMTKAPEYLDARPGDKSLSFLPLCHIAERMASVFNPLAVGLVVHFPENAGTVAIDLREVAPHVVFAPPRFWEKMHSQIELFLRDAIAPARWAYAAAQRAVAPAVEARLAGNPPPAPTLAGRVLDRLALRNIRVFLGLQNCRTALTGAAPVPPDLIRWFLSIGIELREAFGMTETTGFCTATPPGGIRLGWAGKRAEGTEIRLGAENEILVRGPHVFGGYFGQPEKTAQTVDAEGWLHTGDCGEIDADGYLAIRDRIKDILITSGGKNITPSQVENVLKFSPYIADVVVVGEGRNYLTALVMIDHDHVARFAQDRAIPYTDFASLTRAAPVRELIAAEIRATDARLARVEQIKDFRILDQLLTPEDEELTPTMKLKRKVIATKYAGLIDSMYPGQGGGRGGA
jgi:long-chain acyl-CoA synthetase